MKAIHKGFYLYILFPFPYLWTANGYFETFTILMMAKSKDIKPPVATGPDKILYSALDYQSSEDPLYYTIFNNEIA